MNYIIFAVKVIKNSGQSFFSDGTAITELTVQLPQVRKNNTKLILQIVIWGKLSYDVAKYYQPEDYIIIEGYQTIDPDDFKDVYNDMLLKKYLTALLKKQWGTNLLKFEGMTLPGGVTLNGRAIYEDAIADIEKIETDFDTKYQMPPDFYMG